MFIDQRQPTIGAVRTGGIKVLHSYKVLIRPSELREVNERRRAINIAPLSGWKTALSLGVERL